MGEPTRSPADIGLEVVAGLIAIAGQRERVLDQLRDLVQEAVATIDPDGKRDPTFLDDHPWVRPDGLDRMRRAFEDFWLLEAQARDIVVALKSMWGPVALRDPGVLPPPDAHGRLEWLAGRRLEYLDLLERSFRSRMVEQGLAPEMLAELRRAVRDVRAEERRGAMYRERLGRLLSMADLADRAG